MNEGGLSERERLLIGFLVMPVAAAAFGGLMFPLVYRTFPPDVLPDFVDVLKTWILGITLLSVVLTLTVAAPLVFFTRRHRALHLSMILTIGLICGNLPVLLGMGSATPTRALLLRGPWGPGRALVVGSTIGLLCAATFWVLAIRRSSEPSARPQ